jgi:IS30 family transposase
LPGKRLIYAERVFIDQAWRHGMSMRAIATELARPHSTVSREIARNQTRTLGYRCVVAQRRTNERAKRPKSFKLERHPHLARTVTRLLERKWSPEQIAVKLRRDHPDDPRWWVSDEAIYRSIYVQGRGGLRAELHQHLKLKRKARKHGPETRGRLRDSVHISQRPAEAADRAIPGHWEGDLIIGAALASQVGMLTERTTRFTMLFPLPTDRSAPAVRDALATTVRTIPTQLRRSLTWDNGKEMAEHVAFTTATNLQVYFCDPASPWQRGTAENTVGLLRAYLPKGEDLSRHTRRSLNQIAAMLNERPRASLDWQSPAEAYASLLAVQ